MNFGGMTHIIKNPAGTYSYVGAVPLALMTQHNPTAADIVGGRILPNGKAWKNKPRATIAAAVKDAQEVGATLCTSATCACRTLFTITPE